MENNFSFKKTNRLLNKKDFFIVFSQKKTFNTEKTFRIFYFLHKQPKHRIGLIVSKKIAKKAVDRNYIKRFLREWFRKNKHYLPTGDYIFYVKRKFNSNTFNEISTELENFKNRLKKKDYEIYNH